MADFIEVTDGDGNTFGDTDGVVIDFDATTGLAADWMPDLVAGQQYSIDAIGVRKQSNNAGVMTRLGVYTDLDTGDGDLSGFLGVCPGTLKNGI